MIDMNEKQRNINVKFSIPILLFFFAVLGYFVYGGLDGALAVFVYCVALSVMLLVTLIPFAGVALFFVLNHFWLFPTIASLTGIHGSLLTTIIAIVYSAVGLILTLLTTVALAALT